MYQRKPRMKKQPLDLLAIHLAAPASGGCCFKRLVRVRSNPPPVELESYAVTLPQSTQ